MATWCAATSSSPKRAAMAVAVSRVTSSAAVRIDEPAADGRVGADARPDADATTRPHAALRGRPPTRYASAAPNCAMTVPHAEPAMPRSRA